MGKDNKLWFAGAYRTLEAIEKRRKQQRDTWVDRKLRYNELCNNRYQKNKGAINDRKRREYKLRKIIGAIGHDIVGFRAGSIRVNELCERLDQACKQIDARITNKQV